MLHRIAVTMRGGGLGLGLGLALALMTAGAWGELVGAMVASTAAGMVLRRFSVPVHDGQLDAIEAAVGGFLRLWGGGYLAGAAVGWWIGSGLAPSAAAVALVVGSAGSGALTLWQLRRFG